MFLERIETDRLRLERLTRELIGPPRPLRAVRERRHHRGGDAIPLLEPPRNAKGDRRCPRGVRKRLGAPRKRRVRGPPPRGRTRRGRVRGHDRTASRVGETLRRPRHLVAETLLGRGYSGERAGALLELAFDRLDLATVAVSHLPDNENSKRAVEKYVERFGGRYEGSSGTTSSTTTASSTTPADTASPAKSGPRPSPRIAPPSRSGSRTNPPSRPAADRRRPPRP